jgi:acyl dehydratase
MPGLYFEEFEIGKKYVHPIRRTVTQYDNISFSLLTLNTQPLHIDADWSSRNPPYNKPLFNSMFTLAMMTGMQVTDLTLGTTLGNLGFSDIQFPNPVFEGDTLWATTTILGKRASKSKPDRGVVEFYHEMLNQNNVVVCTAKRTGMMRMKSSVKA